VQLVCITGDEDNTVSVVDWKTSRVLITERGDKNKIIAAMCNPFDRVGQLNFVTVGIRHVKFWNMQRGRLSVKKGTFGSLSPTSRTMLSVAFTGMLYLEQQLAKVFFANSIVCTEYEQHPCVQR
jgi:hypothetical protein